MKKILIFSMLLCIISSCHIKKEFMDPLSPNFYDGLSYEKAIVINKSNESEGIKAEYEWLTKNYPGYKSKGQSLNYYKNKPYDIIEITTAEGQSKTLYFDISEFFGKY